MCLMQEGGGDLRFKKREEAVVGREESSAPKKDQRKGVSLAGARMKRALIEKEQCSWMTLHKKSA